MSIYDADARAQRIGERAVEAWYQSHGGSDGEIAVGVVAALALTGRRDAGGLDPAKALIASSDEEIAALLSEIWSLFWIARPELARLTGPFAAWLDDEPRSESRAHAAAQVARAAAKAGLLEMAHNGSLLDCDVIGATYIHMRADSAKQARGEFYTPPNLCKMMAQMTLGGKDSLEPGMSIAEPAAGTGGMLRAAAEHIREQGMDPGDFWWYANDISPVSVAGLAVNCHVWDLGRRVVIGVANTLAEPDWYERAWKEQQGVTGQRDSMLHTAQAIAGFRMLLEGPPAAGEAAPVPQLPAAPAPAPVRPPLPKGPSVQLSLFGEEVA
jgi:hypothetical protein